MNRDKFERILAMTKDRRYRTDGIAAEMGVSNRQVQRVKEAGTWERWPYIQAKVKCGYNTPEYKMYLKRRGLPITPPPMYQVSPREKQVHQVQKSLHSEMETRRRSLLGRLLRRK